MYLVYLIQYVKFNLIYKIYILYMLPVHSSIKLCLIWSSQLPDISTASFILMSVHVLVLSLKCSFVSLHVYDLQDNRSYLRFASRCCRAFWVQSSHSSCDWELMSTQLSPPLTNKLLEVRACVLATVVSLRNCRLSVTQKVIHQDIISDQMIQESRNSCFSESLTEWHLHHGIT